MNGKRVYTADRWDPSATPLVFRAGENKSFTAGPRWEPGVTYVEYEGAPVSQTTVVNGVPKMRLSASTTGPVHLIGYLLERDGATGKLDLNDPVTVCAIQPLVRNGIETVTPITPGARMDMEPQCFTAAHTLDPGDSLVLRVAAPATSWLVRLGPEEGGVYLPNPPNRLAHHVPTFAGDPRVTVFGGADGTAVTVPTVPGATLYPDVR